MKPELIMPCCKAHITLKLAYEKPIHTCAACGTTIGREMIGIYNRKRLQRMVAIDKARKDKALRDMAKDVRIPSLEKHGIP